MCISILGPSSSPSSSLLILFIHLAFSLCFFGYHIFVQNRSVFFISGCWYVFVLLLLLFLQSFSHTSLSDSNFFQVSRTFLSIIPDLNNAVVWMIYSHPFFFKSFSPFNNHSVTVPTSIFTIGINDTFIFHSFPIPLQGPGINPFFHFFSILLCSKLGQQSPQFFKFFFFFFFWLL